mgnify:FL=1
MMENEVLIKTPEEAIETIKSNMPTSGYQILRESLNMAITALKEIQQYRKIGTVEECHEAREKQKAKRPKHIWDGTTECPECAKRLLRHYDFCPDCGQAIQWDNETDI